MSVAIRTLSKGVFSFNLDASNLAEDFDKMRTRTTSFRFFDSNVRKFSKDRYWNLITQDDVPMQDQDT